MRGNLMPKYNDEDSSVLDEIREIAEHAGACFADIVAEVREEMKEPEETEEPETEEPETEEPETE